MVEREETASTETRADANAVAASPGRAVLDKVVLVFLGLWILCTSCYYFLWFSQVFYYANRAAIGRVLDEIQL